MFGAKLHIAVESTALNIIELERRGFKLRGNVSAACRIRCPNLFVPDEKSLTLKNRRLKSLHSHLVCEFGMGLCISADGVQACNLLAASE